MRRGIVRTVIVGVLAGCSARDVTLPIDPVLVQASIETDAWTPVMNRNSFDSRIATEGSDGTLQVTGFVPGDLCRRPLAPAYQRRGTTITLLLVRSYDGGATCPQWVIDTRYTVTMTGLEPGSYALIVIGETDGVRQVEFVGRDRVR